MRNRTGFISNFLLKAQVLYLAISKQKNLSLLLKVETNQFVICLVLPECLSVKICCISPSDSESAYAAKIITAYLKAFSK